MGDKVKKLAILGSTGSVGRQTLEVVRAYPQKFQVIGLAAGKNMELLAEQVLEFKPKFVSFQNSRNELPRGGWTAFSMEEMASHPEVELVMVATTGKAGLAPTLAAISAGKTVALANKEVFVMAGGLVLSEAHSRGAKILPVDSEPSAIWQCIHGEERNVAKITLTASGGPFRARPLKELASVSPEEALRHPTWKMGKKVTIDSATLMNKGMEVIEAHWLFDVPYDRINVVIHPQSIVHSFVEFVDGSVKAKLSPPDMRFPIQYALSYPERWPSDSHPTFSPAATGSLTFESLDSNRYPCFQLALDAGKKGDTYPSVLAAADEVAVDLFLSRRITFTDIPKLVEDALSQHRPQRSPSLDYILAADEWAREFASHWRPT
ncbi:MAG: 1-deoxy-D-xylulose-5-phosphate reductoisomerase [Chloroflexi bacterium]|nr:1-deoxy-D-xylulose-5-phosphate reductoisomerase [Chloroflexota bacterium]